MRHSVTIKINGMPEETFVTNAPTAAKAIANGHAQYAKKLNMSMAQYHAQIKIAGFKAEAVCLMNANATCNLRSNK